MIRIEGPVPAPESAKLDPSSRSFVVDRGLREAAPGVIVELGRPLEDAGTYTAKGTLATALPRPAATPVASGAAHSAEQPGPVAPSEPPASSPAAVATRVPEPMNAPNHVPMQVLASAGSPEAALATRARLPLDMSSPQTPGPSLVAGVATLVTNALKQTEQGNGAPGEEDQPDLPRGRKDGRSRGRS